MRDFVLHAGIKKKRILDITLCLKKIGLEGVAYCGVFVIHEDNSCASVLAGSSFNAS